MSIILKRPVSLLAAVAISAWPALGNADCHATSPDSTNALFELYTSEGCDSCPPADRWFSSLNLGPYASHATELAFHVDYWDRFGWRDRFDNPAFTQRQYAQVERHQISTVYTPQVLLQGREFAWQEMKHPAVQVREVNERPARAAIDMDAAPVDHGSVAVDVHVRVPDAADRAHATVAVALVQSGLVSNVKAGENEGKRLVSDHVVRAWQSGLAVGATGEAPARRAAAAERSGPVQAVAWVEDSASGEVLQALDLPL